MDIGVAIFPTHDAIAPADVARLAEERGHESLFFPEHTHIPAARQSPWPGGRELPRKYAHTFDLFVAITAALTVTSRLRVGSGICLVVERDPITTAKEVASVDYLSGGRFEFGVGAGWNREEMANHGTDPRRRMAVLRERIEAMKAIWTCEEASYAASTSGSSGSGPGRSPPSGPILRYWWAETGRVCWTGCWHSGTRGFPTLLARTSSTAPRSCARARTARSG
jgi:alkanesulfonate monooxygenase SsuD/methylene tetrahydromethanopterin reductase-like flavin-dependent oxidoreductase (luciferase family)